MGASAPARTLRTHRRPAHLNEPRLVRWVLLAIAFAFLGLFLAVPLAAVFIEAFAKGWAAALSSTGINVAYGSLTKTADFSTLICA